jgi:pimeloyl-ACP methyl ester carboxylesterase
MKNPDKQPETAGTLGAFLYSNLVESAGASDAEVNWRFSLDGVFQTLKLGRAKDQWTELHNLTMPTLIIRGENSLELTPEIFHQVQFANSNIRGVEISNAGHWVHADQPAKFLQALQEFAF